MDKKEKHKVPFLGLYFIISLCFAASGINALAGEKGYKNIYFGLKIEQLKSVCPQLELTDDKKEGFCRETKFFGEPGLIYLDFENDKITGIRMVINFDMAKLKGMLNLLKTKYKSSFSSDLAMFEKTQEIEEFVRVFEGGELVLNASKNKFKGQRITLSYRNKKYTQNDWKNIKQVYEYKSDF